MRSFLGVMSTGVICSGLVVSISWLFVSVVLVWFGARLLAVAS